MSLKPTPVQAALVEEVLEGAAESGGYDGFEQDQLHEFRRDLAEYREA